MNEFVVTGADMFGRYCLIEQKSYRFSPNEFYIYKVVSSLRSNCWCEVPYKTGTHEVLHDSMEDCVLAICCGVDETYAHRFRMADVELLPSATRDRDALLALADEMDAYSVQFGTGLQACTIQAWAFSIRDALGVAR